MGEKSPSSRRAWIEITSVGCVTFWFLVALLAEGVDRNISAAPCSIQAVVALLAEGVDRNRKKAFANDIEMEVALLAEGVDRNCCAISHDVFFHGRPPRGGRG